MDTHKEILKTREAFIEKIGMIIQMEGMPRIAGRMFGLLVFDGSAISFGDLARELQISRGSVSSNARFLEERGLIERISKAGERQDFFQLAKNPYVRLITGLTQRMENAKREIEDTLNELNTLSADFDQTDEVEERLKDYINFFDAMIVNIANAKDEMLSKSQR